MKTRKVYSGGYYEKGLNEGEYRLCTSAKRKYRDALGIERIESLGLRYAQLLLERVDTDGQKVYVITLTSELDESGVMYGATFRTDRVFESGDLKDQLKTWELIKRIEHVLSDRRLNYYVEVVSVSELIEETDLLDHEDPLGEILDAIIDWWQNR